MKNITVVFKNAIQIDGSLLSIEDNEMVIQSLDGLSSTIIPNIKENILFYKINSAKETFDQIAEKPHKTQADLENLVKARGDLNIIEKQSYIEKMHSGIKKDQYVSRNQPFPRSIQYPEEKITGADNKFASGLQGMFSKKH